MTTKFLKSFFLLIFGIFSLCLYGQQNPISMFPKAKEGFRQVFIKLPQIKNEANSKVELIVGKTAVLDCNQHFLAGEILTENLEGWGYNYYQVNSKGEIVGTMMLCPSNVMEKKFVNIPSILIDYNSSLPIVVYVPKDFKVKYKIWRAEETIFEAKENK